MITLLIKPAFCTHVFWLVCCKVPDHWNFTFVLYIRLRCCATNRKVAGSIPAGVSGFFVDVKSHYGPRVGSASNRNNYQEYFLGVKAAGA